MKNYAILKAFSEKIFLVGSGNFWYEEGTIGNDNSRLYKVYRGTLFSLYGFMTILEIMAALFGDFPEDEKRDSVTFAVSHTIVVLKILSIVSNKKLLRIMNLNMVKIGEAHEDSKLMEEKYKILKTNVLGYFIIVYVTTAFYIFEGLRKFFYGNSLKKSMKFCNLVL